MRDMLSYSGYTLIFEDHFDGRELDRSRWNVELHEPGWVNEELQAYVDRPETIRLEGSCLQIRPVKTVRGGTVSYASGRISTRYKHDFTYGLFEARLKVPKGRGFLPAFWLMTTDEGAYGQWPVCGEIDHASRSTRNFWCITEKGCWSAAGASAEQEAARLTPEQDESSLTAGILWQTVRRESKRHGLRAEITSFVPHHENVEIMDIRITNTDGVPRRVTGIAAVPIYGRSADNLRDHRNVTSLLHRIRTTDNGVLVKPTMSFDEKGHRENHRIYYVLGTSGDGGCPESFYPTVDAFLGEGGTFLRPRAVYENTPGLPPETEIHGREAVGGLRFPEVTLAAGQTAEYIVLLGISEDEAEIGRLLNTCRTSQQVQQALEETRSYWQGKVNVRCHTGDPEFCRLMRWISFQPVLRRLYGCSFLPHHDYGRGGPGLAGSVAGLPGPAADGPGRRG